MANQTDQRALTILQRSVCLTLECHYLGNNRKIDLEDVVRENARRKDDDAEQASSDLSLDEKQFHAVKRLIDQKEITPVRRLQSHAKAYLRTVAISAHSIFGERTYLIPLALVEEVDARLTEIQARLRDEALALSGRYRAAVERQREALGALFDEEDYVSPEAVVDAFAIDWSYVSFAAPERLETVSSALAKAANEKHKVRLAKAFDEVVVGLRSTALEVVSTLAARLEPEHADGRKKGLRGDALKDLEEFVALLPKLNMTGDDALARTMKRLTDRAKGLDVEQLKSDDALRTALRQAAKDAQDALAKLVEDGPRRGIRLPGSAASAA